MYPKAKVNEGIRRKAVEQEIVCMRKLNSINFPKLYTTFETEKEIILVQEYVPGQSIYQMLKSKGSKKGFGEPTVKQYFK
jgi:serine/threonine protein kinase